MKSSYEVIVVGAGPAGLQAASVLEAAGVDYLVVEAGQGPGARDRSAPRDLVTGVGGAGLFSDGKFSFFPSASGLWRLRDRALLRSSYDEVAELLRARGVPAPPFPERQTWSEEPLGEWRLKRYPSIYLDFDRRKRMTEALFASCRARCSLGRRARILGAGVGKVDLAVDDDRVSAAHVILAGGRYQPLSLDPGADGPFRVEVGVRIEDRADGAFFRALEGTDPKLRYSDGEVEWRTFCCCRDGEVVETDAFGLTTVSGRADGPPSGWSNIGLLVRVADPQVAREVLARATEAFVLLPGAALSTKLGPRAGALVEDGLARLRAALPPLTPEARVHGPAIEGVGSYPAADDLELGKGLWIAGDASGRFRGIVASMVSGRYVAARVVNALRTASA